MTQLRCYIDSLTLDRDPDLDTVLNWAKILEPDPNSMYLDPQHCPYPVGKALKGAPPGNAQATTHLGVGGEQPEGDGEHGQLHVAHPHRHLRPLEDLFKVDPGKPGQHAGGQGGREPDKLALFRTCILGGADTDFTGYTASRVWYRYLQTVRYIIF